MITVRDDAAGFKQRPTNNKETRQEQAVVCVTGSADQSAIELFLKCMSIQEQGSEIYLKHKRKGEV